MPPEFCDHCGADIPPNAAACPECGADEHSGWADHGHQGLNLPDEDFDYDEFISREFGGDKKAVVPKGLHWFWWIVGLVLVVALIWMWTGF